MTGGPHRGSIRRRKYQLKCCMDSISQSLFLVLSLLLPFRLSPFILMDRGRLTDLHGFRRPGVYVCVYKLYIYV
jgi:hypothetical protein